MLLPALNKAREVAQGSKCTSNLKQLGMAGIMYMDAHGDYPGANLDAKDLAKGSLYSYLGYQDQVFFRDTTFTCPIASKKFPYLEDENKYWPMRRTYSINKRTTSTYSSGGANEYKANYSQVRHPSKLVFIGDSLRADRTPTRNNMYFHAYTLDPSTSLTYFIPPYLYHSGGKNLVYLDGHVGRLSLTDFLRVRNESSVDELTFWKGL